MVPPGESSVERVWRPPSSQAVGRRALRPSLAARAGLGRRNGLRNISSAEPRVAGWPTAPGCSLRRLEAIRTGIQRSVVDAHTNLAYRPCPFGDVLQSDGADALPQCRWWW